MNPLRLTAENYRSYRSLELDFRDGLTAIIGANGAGKSSIVDAIEYGLFGGRHASQLTKDSDHPMRLELWFDHGGQGYSIKRSYTAAGRGKATLEFFQAADGTLDYETLTLESTKATQERIEDVIGFTRATWRASSFLAQGDGAAFTEADPRERKAILAETVLGRDPIWPRLLVELRTRRAALYAEQSGLNVSVQRAAGQLLMLDDVVRDRDGYRARAEALAARITLLEVEKNGYKEKLRAAEDRARARASMVDRLDKAKALLATLEETEQACQAALDARREVEVGIAEQSQLAEQARMILDAQAAYMQDMAAWSNATQELKHAEGLAANTRAKLQEVRDEPSYPCPTCLRPLDDETRATAIKGLEEMLRHEEAAVAALTVPDRPVEAQKHTAAHARAPVELTALVARKAVLAERIAAGTAEGFRDRLKAARADVEQLEGDGWHALADNEHEQQELGRAYDGASAALDSARREHTTVSEALGAARAEVERLEQLRDQAEEDEAKVNDLAEIIGRYDTLEPAYTQNGIPALLVENTAIPQIEAEANRILAELGGAAVGVQLHTQRAKKSGDGLTDTLDIVVSTETGQRDYETFSGGERCRVNLSLRVALAALLASRRGADSQILVVDEPDGLDEAGFSALLTVLEGLTGTFRKILVVSHHPELRDSIEQTIQVEKRDTSRLVGEQVAA